MPCSESSRAKTTVAPVPIGDWRPLWGVPAWCESLEPTAGISNPWSSISSQKAIAGRVKRKSGAVATSMASTFPKRVSRFV
jgi:hypothetical protein